MTKEKEELLSKDLCARLNYHPFIKGKEGYAINEGRLVGVFTSGIVIMTGGGTRHHYFWKEAKPYLRSFSKMTKAEKEELFQLMGNGTDAERIDFYNEHHLDYHGLIGKGIALEAPKDLYKL